MPLTPEELAEEARKNQDAFESLKERFDAIDKNSIASARGVRIDVAAIGTLQIGLLVAEEKHHERFARLPSEEFDLALASLLVPASRAVFYLSPQVQTAAMTKVEVKLPASLVTQVFSLRGKMLKLVNYHFGNDPELGSEVADIRGGTNDYPDQALDLLRLANFYDKEEVAVSKDAFYDPQDPLLARGLASQVYEQIRMQTPKDMAAITNLYHRAWTLLHDSYEETSAGATFLFRKEPEMLKRFPPLRTLGRKPRSSTAAVEVDTTTEPVEETP